MLYFVTQNDDKYWEPPFPKEVAERSIAFLEKEGEKFISVREATKEEVFDHRLKKFPVDSHLSEHQKIISVNQFLRKNGYA